MSPENAIALAKLCLKRYICAWRKDNIKLNPFKRNSCLWPDLINTHHIFGLLNQVSRKFEFNGERKYASAALLFPGRNSNFMCSQTNLATDTTDIAQERPSHEFIINARIEEHVKKQDKVPEPDQIIKTNDFVVVRNEKANRQMSHWRVSMVFKVEAVKGNNLVVCAITPRYASDESFGVHAADVLKMSPEQVFGNNGTNFVEPDTQKVLDKRIRHENKD